MRLFIALITIVLCITLVLPSFAKPHHNGQQIKQSNLQNNAEYAIEHEEIVRLTDNFMDMLVQDIDSNYKVKNYHNKVSLIQAFEKITTKEVIKPYIDYYFKEEKDGLYIVPTETPPWFSKQNDYDVVQLENNKALVKQENNSDLFGIYGINIEFTKANQQWKITKITHR